MVASTALENSIYIEQLLGKNAQALAKHDHMVKLHHGKHPESGRHRDRNLKRLYSNKVEGKYLGAFAYKQGISKMVDIVNR